MAVAVPRPPRLSSPVSSESSCTTSESESASSYGASTASDTETEAETEPETEDELPTKDVKDGKKFTLNVLPTYGRRASERIRISSVDTVKLRVADTKLDEKRGVALCPPSPTTRRKVSAEGFLSRMWGAATRSTGIAPESDAEAGVGMGKSVSGLRRLAHRRSMAFRPGQLDV